MHAVSAVVMGLGFVGCAGADVATAQPPVEPQQHLPEYRKNPLLADFMDVCSEALRDHARGAERALLNWKQASPGDESSFVRGDLASGGFQLFIIPAKDSARAAKCSVHGLFVAPTYMAFFDKLEIDGYRSEAVYGAGIERRLSGVSSFGDPVTVNLRASAAQGAATVVLEMNNLALVSDTPQ